jgi:hypothetical protein
LLDRTARFTQAAADAESETMAENRRLRRPQLTLERCRTNHAVPS